MTSTDMKKRILGIVSAIALAVVITSFMFQHRLSVSLREENKFLREQIDRPAAADNDNPRDNATNAQASSVVAKA